MIMTLLDLLSQRHLKQIISCGVFVRPQPAIAIQVHITVPAKCHFCKEHYADLYFTFRFFLCGDWHFKFTLSGELPLLDGVLYCLWSHKKLGSRVPAGFQSDTLIKFHGYGRNNSCLLLFLTLSFHFNFLLFVLLNLHRGSTLLRECGAAKCCRTLGVYRRHSVDVHTLAACNSQSTCKDRNRHCTVWANTQACKHTPTVFMLACFHDTQERQRWWRRGQDKVKNKGWIFPKFQSCALINRICLADPRTAVSLAGLSAYSFSIKPVSRLMPSLCQLAAISP